MNAQATIYIVDDDAAVRDALTLLLEQEDFTVQAFDSAEAFLASVQPVARSCAIVDVRMSGMDGLQLQTTLARKGVLLPVILLTGHGTIPMSVQAIKSGAADFLTKPISAAHLLVSIRAALKESEKLFAQAQENHHAGQCLACLTEREREVLMLAVEAMPNKEIARQLGISHRTVEIHKAHIMEKTGATSLLDLVRIAKAGGLGH